MMRIAIAGASGRMGRMLIESVSQSTDLTLAAALDVAGSSMIGQDACAFLGKPSGVLITEDLSVLKGADCLIDFTRPEGSLLHLAACAQYGVNMVIGTTGFDDAGKIAITEGSVDREHFAIIYSTHRSRLSDTATRHGHSHINLHVLITFGIRQILRRGPRASSLRHRLESSDSGAKTGPTKQKATTGGELRHDGKRKFGR